MVLRKPEADKVEFSIGGIEVTDHSIIEMKQDQIIGMSENGHAKAVTKIKRRHAPPVEALALRKEILRTDSQFWHPTMLQVIRSKRRFRYFF